jgi:hypothetical protein
MQVMSPGNLPILSIDIYKITPVFYQNLLRGVAIFLAIVTIFQLIPIPT